MTHPGTLPAIESNEHSETSAESIERLGPRQSDPIRMYERCDVSGPTAVGKKKPAGFPDSERKPIAINAHGAAHEKPRSPLAKRSSEESRSQTEADKLWDVLKTESGYSSYADYLNAYSTRRRDLDEVKYQLRYCPIINYTYDSMSIFTILDLSIDEHKRTRVIRRCESASATATVESLQQPPASVAVQILLWHSDDFDDGEINALGLGLKISPRLLVAFVGDGTRRQLNSRHVRIGRVVATVVRHYNDKPDAVPIVLIAGMKLDPTLANAIEEEIINVLSFQFPAIETSPFSQHHTDARDWLVHRGKYEHPHYLHVLQWCLEKQESVVDISGLILKSLISLLYLSMFEMRDFCEDVRADYRKLLCNADLRLFEPGEPKEETSSTLAQKRIRLREWVEDSKDDLSYLVRYIRSEISADWVSNDSWTTIEQDLEITQQEAGRLEAQIRDYLQLQVGEWALQESKKSIELSNQQLEESKRVKIFTVLAFVYVPLNLAASIFGMNLSELNGSGKGLSVFLTTAVIALLVTGALWFVLEEVNNYLRWRTLKHAPRKRFTIGSRIGMLTWLQKYHSKWMWKSGFWWRILIDSDSRVQSPVEADELSACEVISKYGPPDFDRSFNPFGLEDRNDWTWTTDRLTEDASVFCGNE